MLLTLELGGQGAVAKPANSAPLSRIEGRFASQLLPQLEIAIVPLLSGPIKRTHIAAKDAEALALNLPEAMAHIFSYTLQLSDLTYALAVAINCEAIVPSPLQKAQLMSAQPRRNDVAAEIGRTRIEVEVLFKLGDQTLERLHALKAGDVIPISGSNFNEAKMRVRGHDLFEGHIGKSGLSYSFKVAKHTRKQTGGMSQMVKTLTERGHNI